MGTYKRPDVYIEEKRVFSSSIVEVPTAVPAFLGYTRNCPKNEVFHSDEFKVSNGEAGANTGLKKFTLTRKPVAGFSNTDFMVSGLPDGQNDVITYTTTDNTIEINPGNADPDTLFNVSYRTLVLEPIKITKFEEFVAKFGTPFVNDYEVSFNNGRPVVDLGGLSNAKYFTLQYLLRHYFDNGGGKCYVISVETYFDENGNLNSLDKSKFLEGLDTLKAEDEPTLIVIGDAVELSNPMDYYHLCNQVLLQCSDLKDRFAILDVLDWDKEAKDFRNRITTDSEILRYGAAYTPYLNTSIKHDYDEGRVSVHDGQGNYYDTDPGGKGLRIRNAEVAQVQINRNGNLNIDVVTDPLIFQINSVGPYGKAAGDIYQEWTDNHQNLAQGFHLFQVGTGTALIHPMELQALEEVRVHLIGSDPEKIIIIHEVPEDDAGDIIKIEMKTEPGRGEWKFDFIQNTLQILVPENEPVITSSLLGAWQAVNEVDRPPGFDLLMVYAGEEDEDIELPYNGEMTVVKGLRFPEMENGLYAFYADKAVESKILITERQLTFSPDDTEYPTLLTIAGVSDGVLPQTVKDAWDNWLAIPGNDAKGFEMTVAGTRLVTETEEPGQVQLPSLSEMKSRNNQLYNYVKAAMDSHYITLPPSAAMAGIYARVDRTRGVWKAPANIGVMSVLDPKVKITEAQHEDLNEHESGKSINVIRDYTGKGTMVMGARTLWGNDREWRYIPVRRLFNMVEESAKKAAAEYLFEPNNEATWLRVKAMIESYLLGLWERGALAGPTPESAFFVTVGLGADKPMDEDDILDGRMVVEIGMAPVRPAEFIILRFYQKMQEAA